MLVNFIGRLSLWENKLLFTVLYILSEKKHAYQICTMKVIASYIYLWNYMYIIH